MLDLQPWTSPLSLILAAAFVLSVVLSKMALPMGVQKVLGGRKLTCILMALATAVIAVEGTWGGTLFHTLPFVVLMLAMMLTLGHTALTNASHKWLSAAFMSHAGLLCLMVGALFGAPDVKDAHLIAYRGSEEHLAYDANNHLVPLPFTTELTDFSIDYYADGHSPKQFTSTLRIDGATTLQTSVNHPAYYNGWYIYQSGYDQQHQQYSILKLVRDPWLPLVYLGMVLLAFGAVLQVRSTWHSRRVLPIAIALAVVFTALSLARINLGTLVPALRSLWFVPHLIIYMLAYSLLAIASVACVVSLCGSRVKPDFARKLLSTSSALLLVGMLCGAAWAKAAWGQYWTWDAKECWAAATWFITLIGMHLPARSSQASGSKRDWPLMLCIWLAFLAMQITWYGVNYLPAAARSLHTYNS